MKHGGLILTLGLVLLGGCATLKEAPQPAPVMPPAAVTAVEDLAAVKARINREFGGEVPRQWGESVAGVKTRLSAEGNILALTFDACGGSKGSGYDAELIRFLEQERIACTLFINTRWIDAHPETFLALARNPLFEIGNHGLAHKPCSVNGRMVYGIRGTASPADLVEEIEGGARAIAERTGKRPVFYRPGTAYCDEVGVQITRALGYEVAGFSALGDAGATFSRAQVREALLSAPPGAIVLLHMNHPEGQTRAGVMDAIPELKRRGVQFVRLSEGQPR